MKLSTLSPSRRSKVRRSRSPATVPTFPGLISDVLSCFSGRYRWSRSPVKLPGKSSQPQAHHSKADQPANIRDEGKDGEDHQAQQQRHEPFLLRRASRPQKHSPQEGSDPNLCEI